MPTFDFRCSTCGHAFEFTRAFGSKTLPACPSCKSKKTEKLMTPPAIQFKGTGFYKTDSTAKPGPKKTKKSDPPPATPTPPASTPSSSTPA